MRKDIFKGLAPKEAYEAYLAQSGEGISPHVIFEYVQDVLQTLPRTEEEMLNITQDTVMYTSHLLATLSTHGWEQIDEKSWEHMMGWASHSRTLVAEANPKYPWLTHIIGIAKTNRDNHNPPK